MPSYKVLKSAEILGEVREEGSVIEVDVETGAPLVDAGVLEAVPEGGATGAPAQPATPTAPENGGTSVPPPTAPSNDKKDEIATPGDTTPKPTGEAPKEGWVGGHTVPGSETANRPGGSVTDRHPDLGGKK